MSDKLFAVAGVVTDGKGRSKVRYGNDLAGRIKVLTKAAGATRLEFVELPTPSTKIDAIKYLMSHEKFQSPEDQAVLADAMATREPKAPKVKKEKVAKVKASKKSAPSLDSIKSRAKKVKATTESMVETETTQ